jgi:hypothetical protein
VTKGDTGLLVRGRLRHLPEMRLLLPDTGDCVIQRGEFEFSYFALIEALAHCSPRQREAVQLNVIQDKLQRGTAAIMASRR